MNRIIQVIILFQMFIFLHILKHFMVNGFGNQELCFVPIHVIKWTHLAQGPSTNLG